MGDVFLFQLLKLVGRGMYIAAAIAGGWAAIYTCIVLIQQTFTWHIAALMFAFVLGCMFIAGIGVGIAQDAQDEIKDLQSKERKPSRSFKMQKPN
jgi:hypothetical protein